MKNHRKEKKYYFFSNYGSKPKGFAFFLFHRSSPLSHKMQTCVQKIFAFLWTCEKSFRCVSHQFYLATQAYNFWALRGYCASHSGKIFFPKAASWVLAWTRKKRISLIRPKSIFFFYQKISFKKKTERLWKKTKKKHVFTNSNFPSEFCFLPKKGWVNIPNFLLFEFAGKEKKRNNMLCKRRNFLALLSTFFLGTTNMFAIQQEKLFFFLWSNYKKVHVLFSPAV